jgi:hypothetical protein
MDTTGLGVVAQKLTEAFARLSKRRNTSNFWIVVATIGFLAGGWLAARSVDFLNITVQAGPLVLVAVVGVPVSALLTAREYHISTKVAGIEVPFVDALRTSVTATAANLLPLPGGVVVRVSELTRSGTPPLVATGLTVAMGVTWIGTAALASSVALVFASNPIPAALFAIGGASALALGMLGFRRAPNAMRLFGATLLVELASVIVDSARLWLVFRSVGATYSLAEPTVISLSNVLASAAGIFPGGLGLREVLAAALAPLVLVRPGLAFLTTAINRLVAIVIQGPLLAFLVTRRRT